MSEFDKNAPVNVVVPTVAPAPVAQDGPVPLSFPSILRNPNFAHLNVHSIQRRQSATESTPVKIKGDTDGKRRVRRQENSAYATAERRISLHTPISPI
ncbi:hypothetical protein FRC08_013819 [Ceratobasidium sp. 394]|nr:hypothetical protein FRC08_013819 [Ceratobasidium sp. 394]